VVVQVELLRDRVVLQSEECLLLEARILKGFPWLKVEKRKMVFYEGLREWSIMGNHGKPWV
jgi:hypothetical protein